MTIRLLFRLIRRTAALSLLGVAAATAEPPPPSPAGRWDAIITANGVDVPFTFEIAGSGQTLRGFFFNGERRVTSTGSQFENDSLSLRFDQYGATLQLTYRDEQLTGEYQRGARGKYAFKAVRAQAGRRQTASGPSIEGTWTVQAKSSKGETAWRFIARQNRGEVSATILRVDGDTGTLTGSFRDGRYVLSHFSGARPLLLEATPQPDGSLALRQNGRIELVARRSTDARAKDIGEPSDPARHTTVRDLTERFRFNFPDLQGRPVTNSDAKFAGKVVLVNISGSWCPNCHDEAPFLASLYRKYRAKGLEIVTLSFEEAEQLANPTRLRAFVDSYGIEHTVLLPGVPDQLNEKVPQAVNLNAFPTTFILGRDGRVRGVHAGFPSPGSGAFYKKATQDVTRQVERLLAERAGS